MGRVWRTPRWGDKFSLTRSSQVLVSAKRDIFTVFSATCIVCWRSAFAKKKKIEAINQATEAREYYSERKVGKPLQKEGKSIA